MDFIACCERIQAPTDAIMIYMNTYLSVKEDKVFVLVS